MTGYEVSTFGAILCANGKVEVTEIRGGVVVNFTRYNCMEEAESFTAWKVARELGINSADVEAVAVKTVPGVYEINVTVFKAADASQVAPAADAEQIAPAQAAAVSGYYYEHNKPDMNGARFIKVERQKLDPIQGGAFVSIGYYSLPNGQAIGIVF